MEDADSTRGRNAETTDDEKAWIINIVCQKPVNLEYSAEVWTRALLTKHINKFAEETGHTRLSTISQSKVRAILEEAEIKPNKITYYCEKIEALVLTRRCTMYFWYINNFQFSLMPNIQRKTKSVLCWITFRFIHLKKQGNILQLCRAGLNLYLHLSMAHG